MLNRSFWKGRRGLRHWSHRLQGQLAVAVVGIARRQGDRLRARPADPAEPVRAGAGRESTLRSDLRGHSRFLPAQGCDRRVPARSRAFHMAAQSVVRRGYEDPIETYSSNVMGTVHLVRGASATESSRASLSTSPATSATRIANGSGDIAKTSPWAAAIPTRTRRVAPNS